MEICNRFMVRIRISARECTLINKIFNNKINNYFFEEDYILVEKEKLEEIVELIGDYFVRFGLDRKNNPTKLGVELENLQDKFLFHAEE